MFYVIRRTVKGENPIVMCEHDDMVVALRHAKIQKGKPSHTWTVELSIPEGARIMPNIAGGKHHGDFFNPADSMLAALEKLGVTVVEDELL